MCKYIFYTVKHSFYYAEKKLLLNKLYLFDIHAKLYREYFVLFTTAAASAFCLITEEKYFCVYFKYNVLLLLQVHFSRSTFTFT